ncbi:class I SAM-dependent methyltransferase [Jatrophihabitans sp.]|uniref:class I SAM-dependent methyltransferase n=1 Tax=Jatrophihabitans sp. TaxID=1932789 RepID=UPI002B5B2270|nr:class I SAM-dependent methyltransferase [Jatrophihabitans sp.]
MRAHSRRPPRASLRRSFRLFRLFLVEQTRPADFYSALADDAVRQLAGWVELSGARVLDVGGGPGYFARAFGQAGARYVGVELDIGGDLPAEGFAVCASGYALPIRSGSVDVAYSSNVVEHLGRPWRMADELVRVTKPGGTVFVSFTPWLSPWGGHETAPWHYLGGDYARRRYLRRTGHEPKNAFGRSLFGHRVSQALAWARTHPDAELVAAFPRYHPWWACWLVRVPVLREVALWNLAMVLRKR